MTERLKFLKQGKGRDENVVRRIEILGTQTLFLWCALQHWAGRQICAQTRCLSGVESKFHEKGKRGFAEHLAVVTDIEQLSRPSHAYPIARRGEKSVQLVSNADNILRVQASLSVGTGFVETVLLFSQP